LSASTMAERPHRGEGRSALPRPVATVQPGSAPRRTGSLDMTRTDDLEIAVDQPTESTRGAGGGGADEGDGRSARRWRFPSAFTVLFAVTLVVWLLAFIIPTGQYATDP